MKSISHLSREKPRCNDLLKLDGFDLSFLVMTGNIKINHSLQSLASALKQNKDLILWGPQAKLLAVALRKAWEAVDGQELTARIIEAFDLTGDVSVSRDQIEEAFALYADIGNRAWHEAREKVRNVIDTTGKTASTYYKKTSVKEKVDDAWAFLYAGAAEAYMEEFVATYPQAALSGEVKNLVSIASKRPSARAVDNAVLVQRIKKLKEHPSKYLNSLADVEAGRVWHHTGIRYAIEEGYSTYQIIAEHDKNTCPVCVQIDGRIFNVAKAYKKVEHYMDNAGDTDAVSRIFSFPRTEELDNLSPDQWSKLTLVPPFHGRCRCDVVLIA